MKQYKKGLKRINSTSSKNVPFCYKCLTKVGSFFSVPGFLLSLRLDGGEPCFPYVFNSSSLVSTWI